MGGIAEEWCFWNLDALHGGSTLHACLIHQTETRRFQFLRDDWKTRVFRCNHASSTPVVRRIREHLSLWYHTLLYRSTHTLHLPSWLGGYLVSHLLFRYHRPARRVQKETVSVTVNTVNCKPVTSQSQSLSNMLKHLVKALPWSFRRLIFLRRRLGLTRFSECLCLLTFLNEI